MLKLADDEAPAPLRPDMLPRMVLFQPGIPICSCGEPMQPRGPGYSCECGALFLPRLKGGGHKPAAMPRLAE